MNIREQLKSGPVRLVEGNRITLAKSAPDKADGPRNFTMLAYTGDVVKQWGARLVFDMEGIDMSRQVMPILLQHDASQIAGQSSKVSLDKKLGLCVEGTMSRCTAAAKQICDLSDEDFPWQASVGLDIDGDLEYVPNDKKVKLNGRTFQGPIYVASKSTLRESSFVPLGADGATKSIVLSANSTKGTVMEVDEVKEARKKYFDGLTISEFKLAAPALFNLCRDEWRREESARVSEIKLAISATGLPVAAQSRIAMSCANLSLDEARTIISREEQIEGALVATGLDDSQLATLRLDIAGLPVGMAKEMIKLCAVKLKGVEKRMIATPDPVANTSEVGAKIAAAVKLARGEFPEVAKSIPQLKEADFIEQSLIDAKLAYTPADLKAAAPDVFK